jgi:hypothetical protein
MNRRTQCMSALVALPLVLALAEAYAVDLTPVPSANTKAPGFARANALSPELAEVVVARGANALENPGKNASYYGYNNNGPMLPAPGDVQSATHDVEASKTEPDKNTYLVLDGQHGKDAGYDYGTHFLFQGHEQGLGGYITRINLDADKDHRVTLLADQDVNGQPLPTFDGSTWYPFSQRLLFTAERGANGGVWRRASIFRPPLKTSPARSGAAAMKASKPIRSAIYGSWKTSVARPFLTPTPSNPTVTSFASFRKMLSI